MSESSGDDPLTSSGSERDSSEDEGKSSVASCNLQTCFTLLILSLSLSSPPPPPPNPSFRRHQGEQGEASKAEAAKIDDGSADEEARGDKGEHYEAADTNHRYADLGWRPAEEEDEARQVCPKGSQERGDRRS